MQMQNQQFEFSVGATDFFTYQSNRRAESTSQRGRGNERGDKNQRGF